MAEYLASIFGTEKDKVNCSFYFKIGACRHGDRCSRLHNRPTFSQTIVLLNLYRNPQNTAQSADSSHCHVSDVEVQEHYDNFFEEVFTELEEKYGEIEEMNVCDNLGDHLVGNVYVKFRREEDAERAVGELNNRWFNGQAVRAELSPVTDFRESCCRQYEMGYGRASRQTWRFLWLSRTPPISGPGYFPSCRAAQPRNQRLRFDLFSDVRKPGQLLFLLSASMLCTAESCCAAKGLLGDCARLRVHIINESCCMVAAVLPFAHQRAPW
ncbi:splicing factor U2AF 26 kDa subunit isoform X2 [Dermochelys coriacea]|uniref:splicing factor U2AF 26 kDa subunit isoform X2 n=1 Tax=Dermochelys coriacea TaxID=27794 RepID=UPI001CAA1C81|nr:splicing factor U2AF 26 kDa subunit isoform X2 [Dermochelys coriacea]